MSESRYRRTRGGLMIHFSDCRYAKNGVPWMWAEGQSYWSVLGVTGYMGIRACTVCRALTPPRHYDSIIREAEWTP